MKTYKWILVTAAAFAATACQTTPFIDSAQPAAIDAAQKRAQFDFNCPAATGQVISRENIQEPMGTIRYTPPPRAEYTIGVAGCDKRSTYVVVCAEGGGCVAGGGREEHN
jgi:hypothetical protein